METYFARLRCLGVLDLFVTVFVRFFSVREFRFRLS